MTLSRRHLLTFAAGAAAGAAMPAGAVAKSRSILPSMTTMHAFYDAELVAAEAKSDRIAFMNMISDAKAASQKALAGVTAGEQWVYFEDEHGNPITGDFEILSIDGDPVRHPEGRDDPTEWA
jgi:hypothetical protein